MKLIEECPLCHVKMAIQPGGDGDTSPAVFHAEVKHPGEVVKYDIKNEETGKRIGWEQNMPPGK